MARSMLLANSVGPVCRRQRSTSRLPLWRCGRGASLVEYLLLVGLISIVALAGFRFFGSSADAKVGEQAESVATLTGTPGGPVDATALPNGVTPGETGSTSSAATAAQGKGWGQKLWDVGAGVVKQAVDTV